MERNDAFKVVYSVEFSPDGSKLYCSSYSELYQIETRLADASAIKNSLTSIPCKSSYIGALQIGPNGKIYGVNGGTPYILAINRPNEKGNACELVSDAIKNNTGTTNFYFGLPAFISSDLNQKRIPFTVMQLCEGKKVKLRWDQANIDSLKWQIRDGQGRYITTVYGNDVTYTYPADGTYRIRAQYTRNCSFEYVDTTILLKEIKFDLLGRDTMLCPGTSLQLNPGIAGATYEWSDGSTAATYTVTKPDTYWVKVTSDCGILRDTIHVNYQTPLDYLSDDTTICYGDELTIVPAHKGNAYIWSTGSADSVINIKEPGEYSVRVRRNYCWEEDKIKVNQYPGLWTALGDEYFICEEDSELVKLDAGKHLSTYLWYPTGETTQWIMVKKKGPYYVTVADFRGCTGEDGTIVRTRCPMTFEFPNAFSPNGDGVNDMYIPVGNNITGMELIIFNAWGERVFSTRDLNKGWDGRFKGQEAPVGTYIYRATIQGYDKNKRMYRAYRSGTLTLLR
jgi:gliding motility-associated-like protein